MRRRELLAGAVVLAAPVAGCVGHPDRYLGLREVSDEEIVEEIVDPQTVDSSNEILQAAGENESVADFDETLPDSGVVEFNGGYFEVESQDDTHYELTVRPEPADEPPAEGEISYESLPEVDKELLDPLLAAGATTSRVVESDEADDIASDSTLIRDQEHDILSTDDGMYEITVATGEGYNVETLAESTAAYADSFRAEYQFELTDLSEDERDVLETAIDDGYYDDGNPDAFDSLIERLEEHERAGQAGSYSEEWLVEYEGTDYFADADYPDET